MTTVSTFESADQLAQMSAMGMEEGATESINQIDAFLVGEHRPGMMVTGFWRV